MYRKLPATIMLFPAAAWAAAVCATDTLANYAALGPAGCTVNGVLLSGFTFSTTFAAGGATPVGAAQVTVAPVNTASTAGLNFASSGFSVSSGQAVQYQLGWSVDDPPVIHGWGLRLFDPVIPPAFITITSEECLGAAFIGNVCPTSSTVTNTASDNGIISVPQDVQFFGPVRIVGELTTITLDASGGGSASFTNLTESAILTPEPAHATLTASIALLLFLARRRLR